jgi:5-formyltetrahydrofolate cyclo-ligase
MLKKDARNLFRKKREALTEKEKLKLDDLLLIQFQSASIPFITSLLSYWPIAENNEPDTHLLTRFLQFTNPELTVCYPVADFSTNSMEAIVTNEDSRFILKQNSIYEPEGTNVFPADELDMVLVPLLAFDEKGYRAGYGKGFYDKFLAQCRPDCIKLGCSYFEPVDTLDDRHEFDVPLDICITPEKVYVF